MSTSGPNLPFAAGWLRDVHDVSGTAARLRETTIDLLRERQRRALAMFHLERALHDLNNHFHAIELRVSFLLQSAVHGDDETKLLHDIETSGRTARQRIEGLAVKAATAPAPPSATVSEAVELAAAALQRDGGRSTVAAELLALPTIHASADELAVVFALLFDNAREAGGAAHVAGEVHEGEVVVTVSDDGPGIADEILPKVCKPFFTTKGDGHRGHGLALAVKLLHATDARLHISNRDDGRGARVTLRLKPAAP